MKASNLGNFFEDFVAGDEVVHELSKTIFESDNNLFSLLTMNHHPVHTNANYSSTTQHVEILVVGTLILSLVVGMTVPDISGKAIANLGYESVAHIAPVFVGDTIYARTKILSTTPSKSKADRGMVYVETVGFNQRNEDVISFRRNVLVRRR